MASTGEHSAGSSYLCLLVVVVGLIVLVILVTEIVVIDELNDEVEAAIGLSVDAM
jgi:hypothetical protein